MATCSAVKVGDTIYISGQLSHDDDGNMVGAAPLDDQGNITDHGNMEIQMRQTLYFLVFLFRHRPNDGRSCFS